MLVGLSRTALAAPANAVRSQSHPVDLRNRTPSVTAAHTPAAREPDERDLEGRSPDQLLGLDEAVPHPADVLPEERQAESREW